MNHLKATIALSVLCTAFSAATLAKEGGDQYPNGAGGFMAGALPPAGNYFINYAGTYGGDFQDGNGNTVNGVEVSAVFDALRIVHVSEKTLFGGNMAFGAILPVVTQEIKTPGGTLDDSGTGDMTIHAFVLGWHQPTLHTLAGIDIFLDTGSDNISANYKTLEPFFGVTYLNDGFEASAKLMYSMHDKNSDTNYQSGDEFHMDYNLAKHDGQWAYGVGGYYVKQLEEDSVNGVNNGKEGQALAFGPQVKYDGEGASFIGKWQHETSVEDRFSGDKFWFKYITSF
jgi:hypothetical protein